MRWAARRVTARLALGIACFFLPFLAINWLGIFTVVMILPIGGLAMISIYYIPRARVGTAAGTLQQVRWHLAHGIRLTQRQVTESFCTLKVRVDSLSEVEILLKETPQGMVVSYKAGATDTGWTLIAVPLILLFPGIITLFTAPWIYYRSARFIRRFVAPLLPADGVLRNVVRYDDIGALLVNHAAEDHRLFSEAYRADCDAYWSALGIFCMLAFVTWFVLFAALSVTSTNPDYTARALEAVMPSVAGVLAFTIPSLWIVHRIFKPRLSKWKDWIARIDDVWRTEATRSMPEDSAPSSFEVLSEAAKEAPMCMQSIKRAGWDRDWASSWILFLMVWFGFQSTILGIMSIASSVFWQSTSEFPTISSLQAIGGVILLIGAWLYYGMWKRRQDAKMSQELANWNYRQYELRRRMERFLEELQFDA